MRRSSRLTRAALLPFLLVVLIGGLPADADPVARALGEAMAQLDASLDAEQKESSHYAFDDAERFDLRLAPLGLEGLQLADLSEDQRVQLDASLGRVLSSEGLEKVRTIRSLEREVAELEGGLMGIFLGWMRDPQRYFLALFGAPADDAAWGMRLDGHHLSLNWTALPDAPLSVTPLFLGGQPRRVPEPLDRAGLRVLADEEDRAVELVQALSEPQRAVARLPFDDGSEFSRPMFVGDGPEWSPAAAAGIPRSSLDEAVRARLDALVEVYLANFTAAVAERQRARIAAQSDAIHFAYAVPDTSLGRPLTAGDRLYYRVQGRGFLIEYDNTAEAADHVHVVWREAVGDFGRDLLAEHLAAHHGAGRSH